MILPPPRSTLFPYTTLFRSVTAQPHGDETVGRKIRLEKFSRRCFGAEKGFCGQIAAAHSAFHGGGPASLGPVTCQKQARDGGLLPGAPAINTGFRRKRRGSLLDYRGLQQFRVTCRRKGFPDLAQTVVDNFLTWLLQQIVRRADNQLQVLSGWHCVCCSI